MRRYGGERALRLTCAWELLRLGRKRQSVWALPVLGVGDRPLYLYRGIAMAVDDQKALAQPRRPLWSSVLAVSVAAVMIVAAGLSLSATPAPQEPKLEPEKPAPALPQAKAQPQAPGEKTETPRRRPRADGDRLGQADRRARRAARRLAG